MTEEEELLVRYERAWNGHDAAACAACFAADGLRGFRLRLPCRTLGHRSPVVRGCEDIEADIGRVLDAVPDLSIEVLGAAYSSDRRLWSEWRLGDRARRSRPPAPARAPDRRRRRLGVPPQQRGLPRGAPFGDSALVLGRAEDEERG
ncbi:MAG TPA: hypothetical protein VK904_05750 [Miltoncostaeaceae bacterium]|nr:hypothetical protein [Miltoncostaeaceae bacterium]